MRKLLQAAHYETYNSVTQAWSLKGAYFLYLARPHRIAYFPFAVHCLRHPISGHAFQFLMMTLISFYKIRWMLLSDIPNFETMIRQNYFLLTQLSDIPTSPESCKQVPLRYLTLTYWTWTSPDLPYRYLSATSFWIFHCFNASLHTTDTFHEFVLFSFAFPSNIKPSTLSTDHYVCCYINRTDILHHDIVL